MTIAADTPAISGSAVLADLAAEVERQDQFHPSGYPATRDGVFLGIKTAVHELDVEAVGAWRAERCRCATPLCGHAEWRETRAEMLQAAAVIVRTIRSIDASPVRPEDPAAAGALHVHLMVRRERPPVSPFAGPSEFACDPDGSGGVTAPMRQRTFDVNRVSCPNCLRVALPGYAHLDLLEETR